MMIQDIAPRRLNNHYDPEESPDEESYLLFFRDGGVLIRQVDGEISFIQARELGGEIPPCTYFFSVDDMKFFLAQGDGPQGEEYAYLTRGQMFRLQPMWKRFIAVTAGQLACWYDDNKFCSRCGTPTKQDKVERMLQCPDCGLMIYPKICPGVIVAVTNGDRILMTRYVARPANMFALIAGFTAIGETVEQTVEREVMEEVGLRVKNLRFYKSQPWSYSDTLLMGFFAELDGDDTVRVDHQELAMAQWFKRDEIPTKPDGVSLTNEMIIAFRDGLM